ncbi:hypothetical protein AVEN_264971-1 [Araneus ventricosus]|uniref:Uncharacterized protein n=1 Tax=Araneus ventricosus TaxID=182803 RepID=A0A4Y2NGI8_ARAVE|nr:hypothetical protein AVEN_264971-1 [Araneus ventricosus]
MENPPFLMINDSLVVIGFDGLADPSSTKILKKYSQYCTISYNIEQYLAISGNMCYLGKPMEGSKPLDHPYRTEKRRNIITVIDTDLEGAGTFSTSEIAKKGKKA